MRGLGIKESRNQEDEVVSVWASSSLTLSLSCALYWCGNASTHSRSPCAPNQRVIFLFFFCVCHREHATLSPVESSCTYFITNQLRITVCLYSLCWDCFISLPSHGLVPSLFVVHAWTGASQVPAPVIQPVSPAHAHGIPLTCMTFPSMAYRGYHMIIHTYLHTYTHIDRDKHACIHCLNQWKLDSHVFIHSCMHTRLYMQIDTYICICIITS